MPGPARRIVRAGIAALMLALVSPVPAEAQAPRDPMVGKEFATVCRALPGLPDACEIAAETAALLWPTYEEDKATVGTARIAALGYKVRYIAAGGGLFGDTTDAWLIARPRSNRLFLVITGTESARDWYENAKAMAYTTVPRDGYYYLPPGHAGFRSGALNVIAALLREREFAGRTLDCTRPASGRSALAGFVCDSGVQRRPGDRVGVVLAGHSRGAGIALLLAPALSGWEIARVGRDRFAISRQSGWPLDLEAVVGYAPPYAIYQRTDEQARLDRKGLPDQWQVYERAGVAPRTLLFLNDRDIVPNLSLGLGAQIGHRFRIDAVPGRIEYLGFNAPNAVSLIEAHGSGGYCRDVYAALGRAADGERLCEPRTYSQPAIGEVVVRP